jgi:dienelactone hydrolase
MMVGLRDTWTLAAPCIALANALKEGGHAADVVVHPEATHQWDNPASTGGRQISMGPGRGMTFVRYDPDTARDSVTRAVAHFRATL